jgi:hypothetical protein
MKRRTHANPMRLLIMLAVLWGAGSLLFAADGPFGVRMKPVTQSVATEVKSVEVSRLAAEGGDATLAAAAPAPSTDAAQQETGPKGEATAASQAESLPADDKEEVASEPPASAEAKSAADTSASPRRFVPSEQVRADFDVSFPIDI